MDGTHNEDLHNFKGLVEKYKVTLVIERPEDGFRCKKVFAVDYSELTKVLYGQEHRAVYLLNEIAFLITDTMLELSLLSLLDNFKPSKFKKLVNFIRSKIWKIRK